MYGTYSNRWYFSSCIGLLFLFGSPPSICLFELLADFDDAGILTQYYVFLLDKLWSAWLFGPFWLLQMNDSSLGKLTRSVVSSIICVIY